VSSGASPRTLRTAADLSQGLIRQVGAGRGLALAPELARAVDRRCRQARAVLATGVPVYGVNTGMGALSGVRLTGAQQREHQRNLLLARATGGPPWLGEADARALIAVRLRTFLSGDAGVSAALCQRLADMLDAGLVPAVPRTGVGCAGEIVPLAHAFGPLCGIGRVLAPGGGASLGGTGTGDRTRPAADALRAAGLPEFSLGPREGHALLAGVPGATALGIGRLADARELAARMEAAAALSIVAASASRDPYRAECGRGDPLLGQVLGRLRQYAGEPAGPAALQAPVSFRVAGPVLAHLLRAGNGLAGAIGRALSGVTDSPAFLGGTFTGTAGFHGLDLAAHCDQLTTAIVHAAEVSAARIHRLLDTRVTGLPPQLAARPGPDTGLVTVHKRAAGEVHALRRLAPPSTVGLIETSGGQEDVQSFGWEAAESLRQAVRHGHAVTSCELLAAYRAVTLSPNQVPPGCRALMDSLSGVIGPIEADRPFGEDIERLTAAARSLGLAAE
jgi:histidine ammonia-lyase